jgi:hypothetical protein
MKKAFRLILLVAVTATLFSACKTREKCPAYGNNQKVVSPSEARG